MFEQFIRLCHGEDQVLLYADWRYLVKRLGILASNLPPDHDAFRRYMDTPKSSLEVLGFGR